MSGTTANSCLFGQDIIPDTHILSGWIFWLSYQYVSLGYQNKAALGGFVMWVLRPTIFITIKCMLINYFIIKLLGLR